MHGSRVWNTSLPKLRIPSDLHIQQYRVPLLSNLTYTASVVHVVVFARTVCLRRGAAKNDFFNRYPRKQPPFSAPRHGMAWHSGIMSYPSKVCWSSDAARPRNAPYYLPVAAEICQHIGTQRSRSHLGSLYTSSASTTGGSTSTII